MKKIILILNYALCIFILSCQQNNITPTTNTTVNNNSCNINILNFKDTLWFPAVNTSIFTTIKFESSGNYFENGNNKGTWALVNLCDSIRLIKNGNTWYYKINSLTPDTLNLSHPIFGNIKYYR